MPFNYDNSVPSSNLAAIGSLIPMASQSPLKALGNTMSELDAIVTQRGKEKYSTAFAEKMKGANTSRDLLNLGFDTTQATPEMASMFKDRASQLYNLDSLAQAKQLTDQQRAQDAWYKENLLNNQSAQRKINMDTQEEAARHNKALEALTGLTNQANLRNDPITQAIQKKTGEKLAEELVKTDEQRVSELEASLGKDNAIEDVNLGKEEERKFLDMEKAFLAKTTKPEDKIKYYQMSGRQKIDALLAAQEQPMKAVESNWLERNLLPTWLGGSDLKFVDSLIKK